MQRQCCILFGCLLPLIEPMSTQHSRVASLAVGCGFSCVLFADGSFACLPNIYTDEANNSTSNQTDVEDVLQKRGLVSLHREVRDRPLLDYTAAIVPLALPAQAISAGCHHICVTFNASLTLNDESPNVICTTVKHCMLLTGSSLVSCMAHEMGNAVVSAGRRYTLQQSQLTSTHAWGECMYNKQSIAWSCTESVLGGRWTRTTRALDSVAAEIAAMLPSVTATPTATRTSTVTVSDTPTNSATPLQTVLASWTGTPSWSASSSATASETASAHETPSATGSTTASTTQTGSAPPTSANTPSTTPTMSTTVSRTPTPSWSRTRTMTYTGTQTPSGSVTGTALLSPTSSTSQTPPATKSSTHTTTSTSTSSKTLSRSASETRTQPATTSPTPTTSLTSAETVTPSVTPSTTVTSSVTPSKTVTPSDTVSPSMVPRLYPPAALTSDATTLTDKAYGNGLYSVTSSSQYAVNEFRFKAFDAVTNTGLSSNYMWSIAAQGYSSADGSYTAGLYSTTYLVNDVQGTYPGEWIQICLPTPISLIRYGIATRSIDLTRGPKDFLVCGSQNSTQTTCTQVDLRTGVTGYASGGAVKSFTVTNPIPYSCYRLAISRNNGNTWMSVAEWQLFGG